METATSFFPTQVACGQFDGETKKSAPDFPLPLLVDGKARVTSKPKMKHPEPLFLHRFFY